MPGTDGLHQDHRLVTNNRPTPYITQHYKIHPYLELTMYNYIYYMYIYYIIYTSYSSFQKCKFTKYVIEGQLSLHNGLFLKNNYHLFSLNIVLQ